MPGIDALGRENIWTISSPVGGTAATANYVLGTASGNTIVGVLNPKGNPKPVYIKRAVLDVVTGASAMSFVWGAISSVNTVVITSTGTEPLNDWTKQLATGVHTARYYAGDTTSSVLAGSTAGSVVMYRPFAGMEPGTIAAGSVATFEELPDELTVAPGTFLGLFVVTGGATIVQAALTVSEGE